MKTEVNKSIGPGTDAATIGLFHKYYGTGRNIPIVRLSGIAAIPREPIPLGEYGEHPMMIIEPRSFGGLSGSPVFGILRGYENMKIGEESLRKAQRRGIDTKVELTWEEQYYLLGIIHGHWDVPVWTVTMLDIMGLRKVNQGMSLATPIVALQALLDEERFREERERRREILRNANLPTPD